MKVLIAIAAIAIILIGGGVTASLVYCDYANTCGTFYNPPLIETVYDVPAPGAFVVLVVALCFGLRRKV